MVNIKYGGSWFASIPKKEWNLSNDMIHKIEKDFIGEYGDRRQEIVFIGLNMNIKELKEKLDFCLLTNEEMRLGPNKWKSFQDPIQLDDEDEDDDEYEYEDEYEDE